MRMSYTLLKNDILRNIGFPGDTSSDLTAFINLHLQTRYQDLLAAFSNWKNTQTQTAVTEADAQYYAYPPGILSVESATLEIGQISYPIRVVNSQEEWDYINEYQNAQNFIPQYLFPRQYDFGIWPIPQEAGNTITLNYIYRDINLNVADYTTGTVTVTNNSQSVSSSGSVFTNAMAGRWFCTTDSDGYPNSFWYLITAVTEATDVLTIQTYWSGLTAATQNFIVGQTPALPEEAHILLSWGVTADWYLSRGNTQKAQAFNNLYYTGDTNNSNRAGVSVLGGVIGIRERYAERSDKKVVRFNTKSKVGYFPEWINRIT